MLCRAKLSSVSQVGLDAATDSVLFFPTGGVSFCSGVDRARGSFGEPKVTPPFLVSTLSDVTSTAARSREPDADARTGGLTQHNGSVVSERLELCPGTTTS